MKYFKTLILTTSLLFILYGAALVAKQADVFLDLGSYQSRPSIVLGTFLLVIGIFLRLLAAYSFYSNQLRVIPLKPPYTPPRFITAGLYRYTRNPLFIGIITILIGWVLVLGSYIGILFSVISFFICYLLARREEKELARKFGAEYNNYRKAVPRWL